ncbi:MAG: heavy metal translocating P-type ATPase [Chloroflexota bacterium]
MYFNQFRVFFLPATSAVRLVNILANGTSQKQAIDFEVFEKKSKRTEELSFVQGKTFLPSTFSDGARSRQLQEISSTDETDLPSIEQEVNRHLTTALSLLGLTALSHLIYPPLGLLSLPGLAYAFRPWAEDAYYSLVKERRLRMAVVDFTLITGAILTGQFMAAALVVTILSLGKKLLIKAEDHSQKQLRTVFGNQTHTAWVLKDNVEVNVPVESLSAGDIIVIHAGETVSIDGTIITGQASVDQRILTGESQPVEKEIGDHVFASTIVLSGHIHVQAEKAGNETVSAQIIEVLNKTADFRHTLQWQWIEMVDKTALPAFIAGWLTLPILGPVAAVNMMWFLGASHSMKVIAPINLLSFLNLSSFNQILIKDGRVLELISQVDTIVFDKTGTLTQEIPHVGNIYTTDTYHPNEILAYAAAAEYRQTHPIALAILQEASDRELTWPDIESASYEIGYGIQAQLPDYLIRVGSFRYMEREGLAIPEHIQTVQEHSYELGYSLICVAVDEHIVGAVELHPSVRPEAQKIVQGLKARGMSLYIISGDHENPTKKLAQELGIDHYFAETLPEHKADLIAKLQDEGKFVCFVGDGINDAIALKQANLSVSLRGASTIATDTAQVILMDESLTQLDEMFDISRNFNSTMQSSFRLSLIPSIIAAGGLFVLHFGFTTAILVYYLGVVLGVGNSMVSSTRYLKRKL